MIRQKQGHRKALHTVKVWHSVCRTDLILKMASEAQAVLLSAAVEYRHPQRTPSPPATTPIETPSTPYTPSSDVVVPDVVRAGCWCSKQRRVAIKASGTFSISATKPPIVLIESQHNISMHYHVHHLQQTHRKCLPVHTVKLNLHTAYGTHYRAGPVAYTPQCVWSFISTEAFFVTTKLSSLGSEFDATY